MSDLAGLLRGTADFIDAVCDAYREQRTGFSDRESGDYLDTAGLDGSCTCPKSQCTLEVEDICDEADAAETSESDLATVFKCSNPACLCQDDDRYLSVEGVPAAQTVSVVDAKVYCCADLRGDEVFVCDLEAGHDGEHIADPENPDLPIVRWPNASESGEVSHEDLAAHITAIRNAWHERMRRQESAPGLSDEIAADLLSDYRVTKK